MKQFLIDNWKLILEICCAVFALVFMCVRKRPVKVVDSINDLIIRLLPYCINQAESKPKGSKLGYALHLLTDLIEQSGFEMDADHLKFATQQVEVILSTPQKKGIK